MTDREGEATTPAETDPATPARPGRKRDHSRDPEILRCTIDVLAETGFEGMTIEMVAARAKAGKATLYRRWASKGELVVDAVACLKQGAVDLDDLPDTGTLRGDLLAAYCGHNGLSDPLAQSVLSAVVTAMGRDPEFAEVYRRDFIGPKVDASRCIYERARERGEVHPDADLSVLAPALAGIVLHRAFLLGETVTPDLVGRVLDEVVLPAALHGPCSRS